MKDSPIDISSQLLTFKPDSYLDRTRRPVYAIAYLFGFLVLYELGLVLIKSEIVTINTEHVRVISFAWIQNMLVEYLNFTPRITWFITPIVVIIILVSLQITSKTKWKVYFKDFIPITLECVAWALPLIVLCLAMNRSPATTTENTSLVSSLRAAACSALANPGFLTGGINSIQNHSPDLLVGIITGVGAGIYEELIFRLILICVFMLILQDLLHISPVSSIVISVMASAILFSVHHHIFYMDGEIQFGEQFSLVKFLFRTIAGVYFAAIFAFRGFAVTAGTHAFYNIIVAFINVLLFPTIA